MPNFSNIPAPRTARAGRRLSATAVRGVFRSVYGARGGDPNTIVEVRPDGLRVKSRAVAADRSVFRIKAVGTTTVTIAGGPVLGFNDYVAIADTEVTVIGNLETPAYIYAAGELRPSTTGAIVTTAVTTFPVHTGNQWVRPLWKVCLVNGRVRILEDLRLVIDLKTWAGP